MNFVSTFKNKRGFGLVEVIVAISIILLVLSSIYGVHVFYIKTVFSNINKVRATFLLEEGVEAIKLIRDQNWENIADLSVDEDHFLAFNGNFWQVTDANVFIDALFERKFSLERVRRESSGVISSSGASYDEDTRKVNVTVSWFDGTATSSRSISTYITNFLE